MDKHSLELNQADWRPSWIRGSKIEEMIWIGKDVLAWCTGVHIAFLNIALRKQSMYWCWSPETGDGARFLSSHQSYPVFAFVERVLHPRIFVLAYPSMSKITECVGGPPSGYVATAFTSGDHLISVGSYPYFLIIIWNWRNGEKITAVNTSIRDDVGQVLRVTLVGPTIVSQMGKTSGQLFTWQMDIYGKNAVLKDHEIKLPKKSPILWAEWCPVSKDPLLAITDVDSHVYLSNYDGSDVHRIVLSQRCGICVEFELPIIAWLRGGIILKTNFCQIRYYTRYSRTTSWKKEWLVKLEQKPYILTTHPSRTSCFFYLTLEGSLMQVDFPEESEKPKIEKYLDFGYAYRFVDFVYPWCHHLVTCDTKELTIMECYGGTRVSVIDPEIDGEIIHLAAHPDIPVTAVGTDNGELVIVSFVEPSGSRVLARIRLQRTPIDLIKFSNAGRCIIAAEKSTGDCYWVTLRGDKAFKVMSMIKVRRPIADILVYEGHRRLRILVLYVNVRHHSAGQHLLLYEIPDDQKLVTESLNQLQLNGTYQKLWHIPGNPTVLIGTPYLTRQLRVQRVQDFRNIVLEDALITGHQLRLAKLYVDRNWISTVGLDGCTVIRDRSVRTVHAHIMTHHRGAMGAQKAIANKHGDLIVSLGYDGSLIATRAVDERKDHPHSPKSSRRTSKVDPDLYEKFHKKIISDYSNLDSSIQDLLMRAKTEFPRPEDGDITWSEWRDQMQLKDEEVKCREAKTAILTDFEVLKGKVKKLLDVNEASPEIEKLPVSAFDLDTKGRDQKIKAGRDVCENLRLELEHNIFEMKRVSSWVRETFWEPQTVVGKSIVSIFGENRVTNYPEVAEKPHAKDYLKWAVFCKKTAYSFLQNDRFEPWKIYTEEELQIELSKKMKLFREDERRIDLLLDEEEEEEEEVTKEDMIQQRALEGTSTHRYFEPAHYYSQVGYYGFNQVMINNHLLIHDSEKLRAYFNRIFDEVYEMKEREMNVIRDRIERIRYIDSELRTMFNRHVPHIPPYPTWHWQEKPESIIQVQDHEVRAKPYISPSEQELLDKQAAEEERIRLLLLADDFRERALMAMMDGVLEVRWEDTIKIDVPKPACMLEKKPEDYTPEDILAVKQYEKDVQFLMEERERYRRMLETEYSKVMGFLKEGIDKFNSKLDETFRLKINIESAINQLYLRYLRGWLQIRQRIKSIEEEDVLKKRITEKEKYEEVLNTHLQMFRSAYQDQSAKFTALVNKEKGYAKKFRTEFATLNKLQTELLERQYIRRPKTSLKNLEASDFAELAHIVLTRSHAPYLPAECKEFMRILHSLDIRPTTLPANIEPQHWDMLVRIRRHKIDLELKLRSRQAEVEDLEGVAMGYEQMIEKNKNDVEEMKKSLIDLRKHRAIEEMDVEMQLVLKMGQTEIELDGDVTDAVNAILVSKKEIEVVNEYIREAGNGKLQALSRLLSFKRGTLLKEWNHECKKKRLQDLEEDLRILESVTVTKEMQRYLKRKAMGWPDEKTPQHLNDDIEAIKRRFQDMVDDNAARLRSIKKEIAQIRSSNEELDRQILEMNVARCDMEQHRDIIAEERQQEHRERKLRMVMLRARLIKKLQDTYGELLELQTEHELLRLKRYPTFHFKMIDDTKEEKKDDVRKCPC